jgi:hypothetical protein
VTLILAIDTDGNKYSCITNVNSSNELMEAFFYEFVKLLDDKRPDWRKTSVLLIDGARYHTSSRMMKVYK